MPKTAMKAAPTIEAPALRSSACSVSSVDWCAREIGPVGGYGSVSDQLVLALERLGLRVRIVGDPNIVGVPSAQELVDRVDPELGDALVYHSDPRAWQRDPARRTFGFTSWETTKAPLEWNAPMQQRVDEIWAPSPWCRDVLAESTSTPVYAMPLGVDAATFSYSRRVRGEKLRFLHVVTRPDVRKGTDLAVSAFERAFGGRDDVSLVIRFSYPGAIARDDARVSLRSGMMSSEELVELYRDCDALIAPSRGEGFGLVPLEAMATGMPAIYPDGQGMASYRAFGLTVSARNVPATIAAGLNHGGVAPYGFWMAPDPDELVDRLREIDADYDRVMAAAAEDAAAIAKQWTWKRSATAIVARLNA